MSLDENRLGGFGSELAHNIWPLKLNKRKGRINSNIGYSASAAFAAEVLERRELGRPHSREDVAYDSAASLSDVLYDYLKSRPDLPEDESDFVDELAGRLLVASNKTHTDSIRERPSVYVHVLKDMAAEALALASIRLVH